MIITRQMISRSLMHAEVHTVSSRPRYWQPTIKYGIKDEIERLFKQSEKIRNLFDNNPVTFAEDAIRRHIHYYETQEKKGRRDS